MLASKGDPKQVQETLDIIVCLFDRIGLQTNTPKKKGDDFCARRNHDPPLLKNILHYQAKSVNIRDNTFIVNEIL